MVDTTMFNKASGRWRVAERLNLSRLRQAAAPFERSRIHTMGDAIMNVFRKHVERSLKAAATVSPRIFVYSAVSLRPFAV